MYKVWWFGEYSYQQQEVLNKIISIIEKNYKNFGYQNIDTPAVERNSILLSKWWEETSKQIFGLYWLAQGGSDLKDYSLRFDLTIPFARYVLDWKDKIPFPFKRYQIDKVRRGERQQKGRFKEFIQADVDIIWDDDKFNNVLYYDAEVVFLLYKNLSDIMQSFCLENTPVLFVNDKRIIDWFLDSVIGDDSDKKQKMIDLIDKSEKISKQKFFELAGQLCISEEYVQKIYNFISRQVTYKDLDYISTEFSNDVFAEWINSLKLFLSNFNNIWEKFEIDPKIVIDFSIVRWLDYYTWIVFETFLDKNKSTSSVASGWRYENLTYYLDPKTNFSWVWWSIWVSRLFDFIKDSINSQGHNNIDYFFINFEDTFPDVVSLAYKFIQDWYKVEIYPVCDKLKKQMQLANRKNAKNVVIMWEKEKLNWVYTIKEMSSWEEKIYNI